MNKIITYIAPGNIESEKVINYIRDDFRKYIANSDVESVVIGQSGGIDSALVSAILSPVCKDIGIEMKGQSIPSASNKKVEIIRAEYIMNAFCDTGGVVDLDKYAGEMLDSIITGDEYSIKIRKGNIKARMRMMILYDVAQLNHGMVLGTDNYTEYLLGFWTLHGDVGDYGCLQNLWKTDVYRIAEWIRDNELNNIKAKDALTLCIDAVPTDGLGITDSDFDQIGVKSYQEADKILYEYITSGNVDETHPVIQRHLRTEFKRNNPYSVI